MSTPLTVLFATTTGNAEDCAVRAAKALRERGHAPRLANMRDAAPGDLGPANTLLVVVSTWGDGEPPDDAIPFWDGVKKLPAGALAGRRFAVLGLGDSGYERFCGFAKECDATLERLGAARLHPRLDCDVDHADHLDGWIDAVASALDPKAGGVAA